MTDLKDKSNLGPFVDPDSLMMSDVLERLDKKELATTRRRDLRSAIRSLCRLLDREPREVSANIDWVHVRLRRVHPVAAGISKKRFRNIKSDALAALELCGASRKRSDWLRSPSPVWKQLLDRLPDKHDRWKLTQIAQFCSAIGVAPADITNDHIRQLLHALEKETFIDKPASKLGAAVSTWNRLQSSISDWPGPPLVFPRARVPWTIPIEQFPESFGADVARWLERLSNPDVLSDEGPAKPLRSATLKHRRFQIQEIASAIARSGVDINEVVDLSVVTDVARFKDGLRYMMSRFEDKPTEAIHGVATAVVAIARHHVKVDEQHLKELKGIGKRLNLEVDGLREKNRERLAQLDDDASLARLLHLPAKLETFAQSQGLRDHRRALIIQAALAIEIQLHAPMRVGNLCRLNLDRHIRRIVVKGQRALCISIPGEEVKNSKPLTFELTGDTLRLYDLYMTGHRPVLLRSPSSYVFPAQDGGHKRPHALSDLIKTTILAHTGLVIHTHLFRSIAGKIHCMIHPGDFLTLSHAIGDSLKTTMKSYAQFEQQNAVRHYQSSVEEARRRTRGYRNA